MTLKELKELCKEQNIDISSLDTEHVYFIQLAKYDSSLVATMSKIFEKLGIKVIIAPPGIKIYKLESGKK